jgi:hypothetical protein
MRLLRGSLSGHAFASRAPFPRNLRHDCPFAPVRTRTPPLRRTLFFRISVFHGEFRQ